MATEKQIAANRLNGLKGGVKTPEGKAISCMNARKHGIFAAALTEHDAEGLRGLLDELIEDLKPVGIVEQLLMDKLAVTYVRMQRCARAETRHYLQDWSSGFGQPGQFRYNETIVAIGLYDARLTKQFLRLLHELEWRQKERTSRNPGREARPGQNDTHEENPDSRLTRIVEPSGLAAESIMKNEPNLPPELPASAAALCLDSRSPHEGRASLRIVRRTRRTLGNDEPSGRAAGSIMKNEPISFRELPASVAASCLDSRLRGNDGPAGRAAESIMKNEPNVAWA